MWKINLFYNEKKGWLPSSSSCKPSKGSRYIFKGKTWCLNVLAECLNNLKKIISECIWRLPQVIRAWSLFFFCFVFLWNSDFCQYICSSRLVHFKCSALTSWYQAYWKFDSQHSGRIVAYMFFSEFCNSKEWNVTLNYKIIRKCHCYVGLGGCINIRREG